MALIGVDLSLQGFVGGVQPLIRDVGLLLQAIKEGKCGGFLATRLEARPKHHGPNLERSNYGQRRDRKQYTCHVINTIPQFFTR
jgi:hypothetical protein